MLIKGSPVVKHETMQTGGWSVRRWEHLRAGQRHPKGYEASLFPQQARLKTKREDLLELREFRQGQLDTRAEQQFLTTAVHRLCEIAGVRVRVRTRLRSRAAFAPALPRRGSVVVWSRQAGGRIARREGAF